MNHTWTDKYGHELLISDMEDRHLRNSYYMTLRIMFESFCKSDWVEYTDFRSRLDGLHVEMTRRDMLSHYSFKQAKLIKLVIRMMDLYSGRHYTPTLPRRDLHNNNGRWQ